MRFHARTHATAAVAALVLIAGAASAWAQPDPDLGAPLGPDAAPAPAPAPAPPVDAAPPAPPDAGLTIDDLGPEFGQPELRVAASPRQVVLGDRFTLIVTVVHRTDVTVNLPEPLELGPAFEIRRRDERSRPRGDGKLEREWQFEVIAWGLGDVAVPPIELTFVLAGRAAVIVSPPVRLTVTGMLGDDIDQTKARGLAPPRLLRRRDWWLALVVGAGVGAVVAVVVIAALVRRRRRRPVVIGADGRARPVRLDDAATEAVRALDALAASGQLETDPRAAGLRMGEIMRTFWGRRHGLPTDELTSSQLRAELARRLGPRAGAEAVAWVERWDQVRYAGRAPVGDDARAMHAAARAIVVGAVEPTTTTTPPAGSDEPAVHAAGEVTP